MAVSVRPRPPVAFGAWTKQVLPELHPPVANRLLYEGALKVMVVGGPNERRDFHIEEGESARRMEALAHEQELFYQLKGDMRLDIMEGGKLRQVVIKEGEMFLLPPRVPHSPQRFPNTLGLVVERERTPGEIDGMRWYTSDYSSVLYEEWFHCDDLGVQLVPVIERFHATDAFRTGVPSGPPGVPKVSIDDVVRPPPPIDFAKVLATFASTTPRDEAMVLYDAEFSVMLLRGAASAEPMRWTTAIGEVFLYVLQGSLSVALRSSAAPADDAQTFALQPQDVFLIPAGYLHHLQQQSADAVALYVTNIAAVLS